MDDSQNNSEPSPAPGPVGALREVRYSLREMIAEVKEERKHSALGRELVDTTEIQKMFSGRKRKKNKDQE